MSQASAVRQIQYVRQGSVYMPYLQSNMGDLFQEYQGTADAPEAIAPDFATLQPVLSLIITSSLVSQGVVVPEAQLAVFSEIYYAPGWQATIDGQPADHFRADWILRAMRVPAGEHTIVFEFRPQAYVTAAYVTSYSSFLILLMLVGAVGWTVWKRRQEARQGDAE